MYSVVLVESAFSAFCGDQTFISRKTLVDLCALEQHVSDIQLR